MYDKTTLCLGVQNNKLQHVQYKSIDINCVALFCCTEIAQRLCKLLAVYQR